LAARGASVELHEAGPEVGGLCRTLDLWGQRVDLGPHRFFSTDPRVLGLWRDIVGPNYEMVRRMTRIYYDRRFFDYPLEPLSVLAGLGVWRSLECLASYVWAITRPRRPSLDTFEDWVTARFGRRLYETFFKSYSEKLWGIPGDELDADFAVQRIKSLDLWEAVKAAFHRGRDEHRTLLREFAYPTGGTGRVYEKLAQMFIERSGRLFLRSPVARVICDRGKVRGAELNDGRSIEADAVVSTMPLTLLIERLDGCPGEVRAAAARLTFRNTILAYLEVEGTAHFPDNWIYVHSPELRCGRITNFRNWTPDLCGGRGSTILCLEFWANDDDTIWQAPNGEVERLARDELAATGLAPRAAVLNAHIARIPRSYPVYRRGYQAHVEVIRRHLAGIRGLHAVGRYGAFKYNNQDHSLLMGILVARAIAGEPGDDPWLVNTAHDYQEAAALPDPGFAAADSRVEPAG
ncbi:MAG: FAD-dependent oxidoreductase, partial [Vicinamibacterales bacterium]